MFTKFYLLFQLSPNKSTEEVIQLKPVDPTYPSTGSLKLVESGYPSSLRGLEPLYPTNMKGVESVHHTSSLKSMETGVYSTPVKTLEPLVYPTSTTSSSSYPSTNSYHPSFPDSTPDSYFQPCQIFQVGVPWISKVF